MIKNSFFKQEIIVKKLISIFLCLIFLFSTVSCGKDEYNTRQTEYHEGVEEIEKEILALYGDYIIFTEPQDDTRYKDVISWDIIYLRSYYHDANKTAELSPYQIAESVREMINKYMETHELFDGKRFEIGFRNPAKNQYASEEPSLGSIGFIRNFSLLNDEQYDCLSSIWYEKCDDLAKYINNKDDIYELYMIGRSEDEVIEIVGMLPNVQIVLISEYDIDEDRNARLNEMYPQIRFI